MKNRSVRNISLKLLAALLLLIAHGLVFSADTDNTWQIRENLVMRLGSEFQQINLLNQDLNLISDFIDELRDLEVYPAHLTGFDDARLLAYDKNSEHLLNRAAALKVSVEKLKPPLIDAMAILREMVIDEPVEDMFKVLERGDYKRIDEMLIIKHQIDTLWTDAGNSVKTIMTDIGIAGKQDVNDSLLETEFFSVIRTNLGLQSDIYYKKLNTLKEYFSKNATQDERKSFFTIEYNRINQNLKDRNFELARKKIQFMKSRYKSSTFNDQLDLLLSTIYFQEYNYNQVLITTGNIPDSIQGADRKKLLLIQSLYALHSYDSIWNNRMSYNLKKFPGSKRNLLIWIIIESGLALNKTESYTEIASLIANGESYCHYVLHALAKTYLKSGDRSTALSILESALKFKPYSETDKNAIKEIRLSIAQIYYEDGKYENALTRFYELLNDKSDFERALTGIIWCYLKLDLDDKAETALKTLINQSPESSAACEALMILAEKMHKRATFEWKKSVFIENETQRLNSLQQKLDARFEKLKNGPDSAKYNYAKDELKTLLARLKNESHLDHDSISALYDKVEKISDLIITHYKTGSFQDKTFSIKREKLLNYTDSVINSIQTDNTGYQNRNALTENIQKNRIKVKTILENVKDFEIINSIDRFRWEKEYFDHRKKSFQKDEDQLNNKIATTTDTTVRKNLISRKNRITRQIDTIIFREDSISDRYLDLLPAKIQQRLSENSSGPQSDYFRYQLGELYYIIDNIKYAHAYDKYELDMNYYHQKITAFRTGDLVNMPDKPVAPKLNHNQSISEFLKVVQSNSASDMVPYCLYSLGWCYNDLSQFDSAMYYLEDLVTLYPGNLYTPQAWMYCGEYYFDKGKLDKAISCYQAVMKYPESEWFDEALYKLAWSQYRISNPEKAISSFLALVDLGKFGINGSSLLEKESMDYIAISFSETDITGEKGFDRAVAFAKKLGDMNKGCMILKRLAKVYREQGRYELSKKTYSSILSIYPNYSMNAQIEEELISVIERQGSLSETNELRIALFQKYNRNSEWAKTQNSEIVKIADSISSKQLYNAAIGFHQQAIQKSDNNLYTEALTAYSAFIKTYPTSPLANECHYNLAEINFSLGNYREAAEEYMAVSRRYPDSKYRENAAWNAIVASQNFLKMETRDKEIK